MSCPSGIRRKRRGGTSDRTSVCELFRRVLRVGKGQRSARIGLRSQPVVGQPMPGDQPASSSGEWAARAPKPRQTAGVRTKPQPTRPAQHPRTHRATSKEQPQIHCHDPGAGRQRLLPPPPPNCLRHRSARAKGPLRGTRTPRAQRQPVKIPCSGTGYKTIRPD